jgi:hypothetical protein
MLRISGFDRSGGKNGIRHHGLPSSPAKAGDPVFQNDRENREASAYWIPRFRGV